MTRRSLAAVLLALSLLLAIGACSNDGDGGEAVPTTSATNDTSGNGDDGAPGGGEGEAGEQPVLSPDLEASLVGQVTAQLDAWMQQSGAPGASVAIVGPGGLALAEVAGFADLRADREVTTEDFWRFGSVNKPITSAVLYHLAAEGEVDIDAPVADYLGEGWAEGFAFEGVEVGDALTVKQMLNYTSGFTEFATNPGYYAEALQRLDVPTTPQEVIGWAVGFGPVIEPGTEPSVTTVGHIVAGLIIEEVTGSAAHEVLREIVFQPAGADAVALPLAEEPATPVVNGYLGETFATVIEGLWPDDGSLGDFPETRERASVQGPASELFDITVVPQELLRSAGWTGGGIEARAVDIARAIRAVYDGTVLSGESVETMTTTLPDSVYAQGTVVTELNGERVFRQSGVVPGFNSAVIYLPQWNIAVAASSNTETPLVPVATLVEELATIARTIYEQAETEADN